MGTCPLRLLRVTDWAQTHEKENINNNQIVQLTAHAILMVPAGDRRDLQERIRDLTQQLEERKSAAVLLTVENQKLKRTVRDLEGRVTDGVLLGTTTMGRLGSNTSCTAGESAAMRALRMAVSSAERPIGSIKHRESIDAAATSFLRVHLAAHTLMHADSHSLCHLPHNHATDISWHSLQGLHLASSHLSAAAVVPQTQEARTQQDEALLQLQDSQQQCQQLHQQLQQLQQLLGEQQVSSPYDPTPWLRLHLHHSHCSMTHSPVPYGTSICT